MTRLRVRHVTAYAYASRVEMAAHMLHLRPRELAWQAVEGFRMRVEPAPERIVWGDDHFGNPVGWVFLDRAHDALRVEVEAVVTISPRQTPEAGATPAWERVVRAALGAHGAEGGAEFAFPSPMAPVLRDVSSYTAGSFPPGRPVLAGLLDLMGRIGRDFRFDASATTVSTPVEQVLRLRAGVCQDFAHLMISGLRGLGLPARYVSGYVRTVPAPGEARRQGADHSHAWVSAWLGVEHGWVDLDPTNDLVVRDEHVWLGWGRDFVDVSPIRGVLLGGGAHALEVSVDLEPAVDGEMAV